MIKQLAHICIYTENLEETLHFYTQILKMEKAFDFIKEDELFGFYLHAGNGSFIEFFNGDTHNTPSTIKHFCLEVEDIDLVIHTLKEAGTETKEKNLGIDNTWQTWCHDPNGVQIEFHQYTKDSLQFKGGTCKVNW